eukprot:scaffold159972_cov39-Prasinocladus_malaysianus.AAC.1
MPCPTAQGALVYPAGNRQQAEWSGLAGYDAQKAVIEDTLLLALQRPEVYESIARRTRASFASNRPRAVLFEGPPGTGKTTSGRIIAAQVGASIHSFTTAWSPFLWSALHINED